MKEIIFKENNILILFSRLYINKMSSQTPANTSLLFNGLQLAPAGSGYNWPTNLQGVITTDPVSNAGLTLLANSATRQPIVTDNGYFLLGSTVPSSQRNCPIDGMRGGYSGQDVNSSQTTQKNNTVLMAVSAKDLNSCSYST